MAAGCLRGNEAPTGDAGMVGADVKDVEGKELTEPRSGVPSGESLGLSVVIRAIKL